MKSASKLGPLTITLHWFVAIGFMSLCMMGIYMVQAEAWGLYWTHKSLGVLIFIAIVLRVVWRVIQGWPVPVSHYNRFEQKISKLVHWGLLLGTLFMPISGMIHSGVSGHGFGVFAWHLVADNPAPNPADGVIPHSTFWALCGQLSHRWVGYFMLAIIALHIIGALKHHLADKDRTLLRMLGK